ncbi:carbohydrate ABC transporter permease [Noviherbaspirillum sp. Root189]|uniref:carbohydrate ABC transporter permease n=1 Tax=Noviherbaspirillum sp. Root189 TaxID=1736487 RepID=UPI00070C6FDD|nr:carbohydrate ABC transporter permease [Noviherbaspirillum sp. Root189]KRB70576.1 ABC transporter permease [Noviherbaspirillum sp. Root189]
MNDRPLILRAMTLVAAALLGLWSFFPIYWMIASSVRPERDLFAPPKLIPENIDWKFSAYRNLLELTDYPVQFANSVQVALAVVVITLLVSVVIAYVVTRYRVPGKTLIIGSMLYAYMFPPLLLAIPLLSIFARMGLADHLIAVVMAHCTLSIPLGVWMLWGFFKAMPFDLEEAAMVDGCSRAGAFFRMVLPLSAPGIITVAIFSFLLSWTDYVFSFVLVNSDANKTLPVGLASILGTFDARWGELMAGATLIALPLFIMFMFLSRYFIKGLAAGALKG